MMMGARIHQDEDFHPLPYKIVGLTADSRQVKPGYLFAALPGSHCDGRDFVAQAVEKGATHILAPLGTRFAPEFHKKGVELICVAQPRRVFAQFAAQFYPGRPDCICGVTGTNGKSSVADFCRQIWQYAGKEAASLGTLGMIRGSDWQRGALTTPDSVALHRQLDDMAAQDISHVCLEASSHGLDQYRLDGLSFQVVAFTSFSRDHLDYHGDMDRYLAAKMRLLTELLPPNAPAIINADMKVYPAIRKQVLAAGRRVVSYGLASADGPEYLQLVSAQQIDQNGQSGHTMLDILWNGQNYQLTVPLIGSFQIMNVLAALSLVVATGMAREDALAQLPKLRAVPGRMEMIGQTAAQAMVLVDYAHTPDALQNLLPSLREGVSGKLWVVFGCGGDRDPGKRAEMGQVAAKLADHVVVTDDNPRSEDPQKIRHAIQEGIDSVRNLAASQAGSSYLMKSCEEIADRAQAIAYAIQNAQKGDVIVIAGKGHETGQIIGDKIIDFDDRTQAADCLTKTGGRLWESS